MAHTTTFDIVWNVNGLDLTETHIVALSGARWAIPVIMVSGDNVLAEQLPPDFPDLEYAVVKTAKSLTSAEPVPRAEADRRIEAAARRAMEKFLLGKFRAFYMPSPYDFRLTFRTSEEAQMAAATRGVLKDGDFGVRYQAGGFIEGYELGEEALGRAVNRLPLLIRILRHEGIGERILQQLNDLVWMQIDPSQLPEWSQPPVPSAPAKRKYWGDQ